MFFLLNKENMIIKTLFTFVSFYLIIASSGNHGNQGSHGNHGKHDTHDNKGNYGNRVMTPSRRIVLPHHKFEQRSRWHY